MRRPEFTKIHWALLSFSMLLAMESSRGFADYQKSILDDQTFTYTNSQCELTNSCNLKEFSVRVTKIKSAFEDDWSDLSFMSLMVASYKTDTIENLPQFGVVQFIRGCVWSSYQEGNGIINRFDYNREFFGKHQSFVHPQWVIDSIDADPLYATWDDLSPRHYAYKWNPTPQLHPLMEDIEKHYYGQDLPPTPWLYVSDTPQGGHNGYNPSVKVNSSLEFRTCLYKTSDVPLQLSAEQIDFATPLVCFDWNSSDVYDYKSGQFAHPQGIDPQCLKQP